MPEVRLHGTGPDPRGAQDQCWVGEGRSQRGIRLPCECTTVFISCFQVRWLLAEESLLPDLERQPVICQPVGDSRWGEERGFQGARCVTPVNSVSWSVRSGLAAAGVGG